MTEPAHILPPLNPMHRAPRDGTRIVVMDLLGQIVPAQFGGATWTGWVIGHSIGGIPYQYEDAELLGWWPMPEARE